MCISRHQPHLPRSDRVRAINLSLVLLMRTLGLRETWGVWCNVPSDLSYKIQALLPDWHGAQSQRSRVGD